MKVLVKQDSATATPVDCGEGKEGEARLRTLVGEYGTAVTLPDGSPLPKEYFPPEAEQPKKRKKKHKATKPKAAQPKAKARKSKKGIR